MKKYGQGLWCVQGPCFDVLRIAPLPRRARLVKSKFEDGAPIRGAAATVEAGSAAPYEAGVPPATHPTGANIPVTAPRPSIVIAIDGPAASGKGTLARRLAARFGFAHLDTGLLYRAVGVKTLADGGDPADKLAAWTAARSLTPDDLDRPDLRDDRAARAASQAAAIPEVRAALLAFQRGFAEAPPDGAPGAVLDGRDIGAVVCPDATAKLFVTASLEARANRRYRELRERGVEVIYEDVLADMKERDARDSRRTASPMTAADDALKLDTSSMDADQAFAAAMDFITARIGQPQKRDA